MRKADFGIAREGVYAAIRIPGFMQRTFGGFSSPPLLPLFNPLIFLHGDNLNGVTIAKSFMINDRS